MPDKEGLQTQLSNNMKNELIYHAKLGQHCIREAMNQYEAIERKFMMETKKDIVDKINLDHYFTELVIVMDNLTSEYKTLSNLILESKGVQQ